MTNKQLANKIRRTRGKIFVWVHTKEDGVFIAIEKSDFITQYLMKSPDEEATLRLISEFLEPVEEHDNDTS
jgi:hypothetical protein